MGQYLRTDFSAGWQASSDKFNCPKNGLLRMDNLTLDELGALALRQGSAKINSSAFTDTDCHSLFTTALSGVRHRMTGATDAVYDNGTSIATSFAGSGDIAFGAHMGQILFARSTTKKKYDGTTVRNWGIAAPAAAPTLAVLSPDALTLVSCDSTELPVLTSNEGTQSFVNDRLGVANAAVQILPDTTTGRGVSTKTFTAPMDFSGSDDDLVNFYVRVAEPQYVTSVTLMVDFNGGTFQDDYAERTFVMGDATEVIPEVTQSLASNYDVEGQDRDQVIGRIENRDSVTQFRQDVPSGNTGWNHFSVPRGAMKRSGLSPGKNWATVEAVRLIVTGIAGGSAATARFDEVKITGAGFTGKYTARVVAAYDNGTYVALSGPSAISNEMEVSAQGLTVTVDAATMAALDPQVTQLWIYLMGGRLNAFYRFETVSATQTAGAFDHVNAFETDYLATHETVGNYTSQFEADFGGTIGPFSHNHDWEAAYLPSSDPLTVIISTDELTALIANIRLETDNTTPPDSIIGIEGPHFDRTLALTADFIYPSRQLNPDSYATGEAVRVGDATETALWIKKLGRAGLYVGTTRDIYELNGDWTVLPDGSINVTKIPLHVSEPPISSAIEVGNINGVETLIYLSGDGWHALGSGPLVNNAVDLLWRGFTQHDVSFVNITSSTARFRVAVSKNIMFAMTPEGGDTTSTATIHAYHFGKQRWYRFTYPQAFRSIYAESDGTLIAGDASGFVRQLDIATKQDDGVNIPVVLRTACDDNGQPFTSKDAGNLWMRLDTGGSTATVAFHLNGNDGANVTTTTAQSTTDTANQDVSTVSEFSQLQLRITGSFSTFVLRGWGLRYLDNPMPQVYHDTGFVDLTTTDENKWIRALEIKAKSTADLSVATYWDGGAGTTDTVSVAMTPGVATIYRVPLGREDRAKVARVVITSSLPSHVYYVKFLFRGTGRPLEKTISLVPEAA